MNNNLMDLIANRIKASKENAEILNSRKAAQEKQHSLLEAKKSIKELDGIMNSAAYKENAETLAALSKAADLAALKIEILNDAISREMQIVFQAWAKDNQGKPFWHKRTMKSLNDFMSAAAGVAVDCYVRLSTVSAYIEIKENCPRLHIEYIGYTHSEWAGNGWHEYVEYRPQMMIRNAIKAGEIDSAAAAVYAGIAEQAAAYAAADKAIRERYNEITEKYGCYSYLRYSAASKIEKSLITTRNN